MSHDDSVQLGTISLPIASTSPSSSASSWQPLTTTFFDTHPEVLQTSKVACTILRNVLNDVGLGFQGEWIRMPEAITVRCRILPSDAVGSMWKAVPSRNRERNVKDLLRIVGRSWQEGDETGATLMGRRTIDYQSMQDIYTSVPSPPDPFFHPADSSADQELFDAMERFDNPLGVKTDLYRYQLRSVAKMVQMEMQPDRLVDPLFSPFEEAGRSGTYYVNLTTWDVQRHPGWYELPRGGILCEQMGTGKTLMCLSLIATTQYQPTRPPANHIDISPVTTDVAERRYPFSSNADLRHLTGYQTDRTRLILPSLVELCANLLAVHEPNALNGLARLDHLRPMIERKTFYCDLPPDDECSRLAKRKVANNRVKKIYLAKGTLVVVPSILIQQWRAEIELHLEEGSLKVYQAIDQLNDIEMLLDYDIILMETNPRWKRIILDEGHIAKDKGTNAMALVRQLSVERRWLVSGTPTRHLQQGGELELESFVEGQLQPDPSEDSGAGINLESNPRQWTDREIEDVTRIGKMIGGYLAAEPFKSDMGFQQHVTSKLKGPRGPAFGAVERIRNVMSGVMVKHEPKQIDREARLPPLTISHEVIQFDPLGRITYNVLAALVSSNVYTSGGEDADYFLHPRNRDALIRVVDNLHLACFWYSAHGMDADGCLFRTQEWLRRHPEAPDFVTNHLQEACAHLEKALATPGWAEWMAQGVSMPLEGHFLPSLVKAAWSDSFDSLPDWVDLHSFINLRELNRRGATVHDLHMEGWDYRNSKTEEFSKLLMRDMEKHSKAQRQGKEAAQGLTAAKAPVATGKRTARKPGPVSPSKRKRKRDEVDERLDEAERNAAASNSLALSARQMNAARPLPEIMYTRSHSAKVNRVIRTILEADKDDKFVIFGDSYELGHLTEILDLVDVSAVFVGGDAKNRRLALDRFQKAETRVCLLDPKIGARGLNLVVANRVIFLQPIWNLDVQAQAIKRVHRIGQTRPTTIHILVMEDTFEEDIARRSTQGRTEVEEKLYSRAMIENPKFVYAEREDEYTFPVRLTPTDELPVQDSLNTATTNASSGSTPSEAYPITPVSAARQAGTVSVLRDETPTPLQDGVEGSIMSLDQMAEPKREKKRVRVAFA
ncbi:hypothetical protein IAU60_006506 [Kwoniella sp. DSM 27419]